MLTERSNAGFDAAVYDDLARLKRTILQKAEGRHSARDAAAAITASGTVAARCTIH